MKLEEILSEGKEFLDRKNIPMAYLNARLLIEHTLSITTETLYTWNEKEIEPELVEKYRKLLRKRGNFEPIQYILGYTEFYGRRFIVTKDVLIPRPETELIIDYVREYSSHVKTISILDIGTGSGNIAITIKKEISSAEVFATDISYQAISIAQLNAKIHQIKDGFYLLCSDLFSAFKPDGKFDVIVANPPYVPTERINSLQPEIKLYEPREAIDGGRDGLDKIKKIISNAGLYLKKDGKLIIEIDSTQGEAVMTLSEKTGMFKSPKIAKDLSGFDRIFIATCR